MAIIYGTLYMMFGAFPIVFHEDRGWSEGISGLAFLGVAVGMMAAVIYTIPDNERYNKVAEKATADGSLTGAPPEARLPPTMLGSILLPIGLFVSITFESKFSSRAQDEPRVGFKYFSHNVSRLLTLTAFANIC